VQIQNEHAFPSYGLPPNYTPPNVAYTLNENLNNSTPIPIESQQPQSDHAHASRPMEETHEIPHHDLADFEPWLGYATERQAVGGIPFENTLESPQYHPQLHLLHSTAVKKTLMTMAGMGELDHLEERLRAIEGGEDYAFAKPRRVVPNTQTWSFPSSRCRTLASIRGLLAPRTI